MGNIKINNQSISKLYLGNIAVKRAYSNGSIVYDTGVKPTPKPCFEVVDTITNASGKYVDVYAKDTQKWYKKNNLNQYEEYGIVDEVADLSTLTYYTGKLAVCSGDDHEYKWNGSSWIDLGSCGRTCVYEGGEGDIYKMDVGYNWGYKFKAVLRAKKSSDYSDGVPIQTRSTKGSSTSPIELGWNSNGFYLDRHNPQGTSNYNCGTTDFDKRTYKWSCLNNYTNQVLDFELQFDIVSVKNTGGQTIASQGNGFSSISAWYGGLYYGTIGVNSSIGSKLYSFKIYNEDGGLIHDFIFRINNTLPDTQKLCLYDKVTGAEYPGADNIVSPLYSFEGTMTLPEQYDTKVAPADNVHYNTLEELELMECPWIGMKATVGQDYTLYVYKENGWVIGDVPLNLPYLRFTALEDTTFTFKKSGYASKDLEVKYSIDGGEWNTMVSGVATPIVKAGSYVLLKSNFNRVVGNKIANGTFSSTGDFGLSGNSMSLIYGDEFENQLSLKGKSSVFHSLFKDCAKLKSVSNSVLPATTLAGSCYYNMFYNCTGLTSLPAGLLPATTLTTSCYYNMFYNCTGLTSLPEGLLPATTLTTSCYSHMFGNCTGITSLPAGLLPATNLANSCYYSMFSDCTGITSIPEVLLPATTLTTSCYSNMFVNCTGLTSLPEGLLPATTLSDKCYYSMFGNCIGITSIPAGLLPSTTLYNQCYYDMFYNCTGLTSIPSGLLPATTLAELCYFRMFGNCTGLTSIPAGLLPATTLSDQCYSNMFVNCTGITSLPERLLPATTLSTQCYYSMFSDCTGITSLPAVLLPATTLSTKCYYRMFYNCTGLTSLPEGLLPANTLATSCYSFMFSNCTGLTSLPEGLLPATNLANSCYSNMFASTQVTSIPSNLLPATTLADSCYNRLFYKTPLLSVPAGLLPSTELKNSCYKEMFSECTNLKSADIELPATTVNNNSAYYNMFYNCNNLLNPPTIKATSVSGTNPFGRMFYGCSNMKYLVCYMLNEPSSSISKDWLNGVPATGTFYMSQDATWDSTVTRDANGIPAGWTIVKVDPNDYQNTHQ